MGIRGAKKDPGQASSYISALGLIAALVTVIFIRVPLFWAMGTGTVIATLCARRLVPAGGRPDCQ